MRTSIVGLMVAAVACATGGAQPVRTDEPERKASEAIREYVSRSRSWSPDQYRIEERGSEGGMVTYLVIHVDDEKGSSGQMSAQTGGKSFLVFFDPHTQEVVRELKSQ